MRRRDTMNRAGMAAKLAVMVGVLCAIGCTTPKKEIPTDVLTKPQLTSFMIEMYVAEAHLEGILKPRDSAIKLFIPYEEKLKRKYGISDSTLKKTYQYYLENPKELEEVYDALIDSLNLKEQKAIKD
ncbi:MAG: DUF4296 domain-containing protein [Cyclobacteriaceae bacterium]|nr:DUF4296 domain-containing protein [Cyclobacteriaceae bacterium]